MLPGPPAIYQTMLDHPDLTKYDTSTLRLAVTGAAAVPVEMIRRMRTQMTFETIVTGYPATQHSAWRRLQAFIHRLPDLFQRTRALEDRVTELEGQREREGVR